jgi:2-hydroxychromene-2-carboxylate isomerase
MVMRSAEFLFDFASPNAYLSHKVIPAIEARTGKTFRYTPVLLGGLFKLTGNQAPMIAFGGIPNKMAYERLEMQRFIERYKLPFVMNPHFPVNTLLLMRMATAAEMSGTLLPFVDAAMRMMWETPQKMDDPQVAVAALVQAGIDAETLLKRSQDADVKARLMTATEDAAKRGAFGIPTFFVGKEIYFGKNTLRDVEEALQQV